MKKWAVTVLFTIASAWFCAQTVHGQTQSAAGPGDEILAVVDGQKITQKEIDDLIKSEIYGLQEKIYNLRKKALNNLITKLLLENEAKAQGITNEQLRKRLVPETVAVEKSRIDEIYTQNANRFGNLSEDEAKQKIKMDLENRARFDAFQTSIAGIKSKAKIEVLLREPDGPVVKISPGGSFKGAADAPVTIVEFSDFQCPYCNNAADTLKQLLQTYSSNVKLVFKHLPLPNHQHAFKAAQAAFCAGEQGKFWEYHDTLFAHSNDLSANSLKHYAADLGLKADEFSACLDSELSRNAVMKDLQEAKEIGVAGTPTFFVNGRILRGAKSLEDLKAVVAQELKKSHSGNQAQERREKQ